VGPLIRQLPEDSQALACDNSQYFTIMRQKMEQYNIQPQNYYNIDEKGFLIGYLQKVRKIFPKALM
jgi:hypothetical protein